MFLFVSNKDVKEIEAMNWQRGKGRFRRRKGKENDITTF